MSDVTIRANATPNPNSMLFHVDRTVTEERMKQFDSVEDAGDAPLARALFAIDGVKSVFFMPTSITVSKVPEADWNDLAPAAETAIREHFGEG